MASTKKLVKTFSALAMLRAVNVLLPLALYPVLLHRLGAELLGLVVFAQAVATYFMVGVNYATETYGTRLVSRLKDQPEALRHEVSQLWWMKVLLLLVVLLAYGLLLALWPFTHPHIYVFVFSLHVVLYEAFFPVWFYQGIDKVHQVTLLNVGSKILGAVLLLSWVTVQKDAWLVPTANTAAALVMIAIATLMLYRRLGGIAAPSLSGIIVHLRGGWPFFVTSLAGMLYVNANRVLIGAVGMAEVAYYDLADRVVQLAKAPQQILGLSLFPKLSTSAEAKALVRRFAPYSVVANALLTAAVFAGAPLIVSLLSPGLSVEGAFISVSVMQILSLNILVVGLESIVVVQQALAQNHERAVMRFTMESVALYAGFVLALVAFEHYRVTWLTSAAVLVECYLLLRTFNYLRRAR
ncbi:MAG: oligosaccharide flippase family protein [Cryomorphaceae bacterium]|nr:oligosaccharide flippase family protein [Cryomorphaceae bacterium]